VEIKIRLLASYRRYLPRGGDGAPEYGQEIARGTPVGDVLDALPIPPGEVYTFFVNGRHAERSQPLEEGDVLAIFPAVGGG
jgi:molybdopterin converting factor small subunit